jgi:hypothetical protein
VVTAAIAGLSLFPRRSQLQENDHSLALGECKPMVYCMGSTHRVRARAFDFAAAGLVGGAVIHLITWLGGPRWTAALGAPPSIVASAAAGSWPALLGTLAIAALLIGLASCCFMAARRTAKSVLLRGVLALVGVILLARGLLVVPFVVAGQREWRTPIGKIIVTGDWFAAGSLIVLAIGALMVLGVYQTRSERTPDVSGTS